MIESEYSTILDSRGNPIKHRFDAFGDYCPVPKRDIDSDHDCSEYEKGSPLSPDGECESDGHYMCNSCLHYKSGKKLFLSGKIKLKTNSIKASITFLRYIKKIK